MSELIMKYEPHEFYTNQIFLTVTTRVFCIPLETIYLSDVYALDLSIGGHFDLCSY
ncbi:hypothetical protein HanIR_Chr12g0565521 [Helianthus annuus]|nr:hypothetical protein HanIR_Chr12g0565521 [Helianthus annuus]